MPLMWRIGRPSPTTPTPNSKHPHYLLVKSLGLGSMNTRSEAIAYLKARGLDAKEHDWSHGLSIRVVIGPSDVVAGMRLYPDGLIIYPRDGLWSILHDMRPDERRRSLQEVCDAV